MILDLLFPAYSWIGSNGLNFFLISSSFGIVGFFFSKKDKIFFLIMTILPVLVLLPFLFLLHSPNPITKDKISILVVPWSKSLGENTEKEKAISDLISRTKKALSPEFSIIVWPETAIPGLAEQGNLMTYLNRDLLSKKQYLLFGSDRKEFSPKGFSYFNSAYLLSGDQFSFKIYRKEKLVPFAEHIPSLAKWFQIPLMLSRKHVYEPGQNKIMQAQNWNLGVGICFEALFDSWYQSQEDQKIDFYIFLNREFLFSSLGKKSLLQTTKAKAAQTYKPVIRVTNGGFSGLIKSQSENNSKSSWDSKLNLGKIEIPIIQSKSPFYQFGQWLIPILIILYTLFLLFLGTYFNRRTR